MRPESAYEPPPPPAASLPQRRNHYLDTATISFIDSLKASGLWGPAPPVNTGAAPCSCLSSRHELSLLTHNGCIITGHIKHIYLSLSFEKLISMSSWFIYVLFWIDGNLEITGVWFPVWMLVRLKRFGCSLKGLLLSFTVQKHDCQLLIAPMVWGYECIWYAMSMSTSMSIPSSVIWLVLCYHICFPQV